MGDDTDGYLELKGSGAISLQKYFKNKFGVDISSYYDEKTKNLRCILRKGNKQIACDVNEALILSGNDGIIGNILDEALAKLGVTKVIKEYNPSLRGGSICKQE